jgi:hypothetical protein
MKKITLAFFALAFIITISCSSTTLINSTMATATATPFLPLSWMATETKRPDFTRIPTERLTPTQETFPTFGPPTDWPQSLDQLWEFIETGHSGYTFETCREGELQTPWISWSMLKEAVAVETPERQHPCLQLWGDDISRIITPGGGYFPNEHRLVTVNENDVFLKLLRMEGEPLLWLAYEFCQADPVPHPECPKDQPNPFNNSGGIFLACGDGTGKPILYGSGVQVFLDWLASQPEMTINQCKQKYPNPSPGSII